MYEKNKFLLQRFFKSAELKTDNFNNMWLQLQKTIRPYQKDVEENLKRIGDFEFGDSSMLNLKDIYTEYQTLWETSRTIQGISVQQLKKYLLILFSNPNGGVLNGLYDNPEQFDDFLEFLIKKNSQACLRKLFSELLYYYPKDKNLLFKRLKKLYNSLDKQKRGNQLLVEANTRFQLVEEKGPLIIAQNILDTRKDFSLEVLPRIWLKEEHLISNGIGQSIVKELCYLAKKPIQKEDKIVLECFLQYLSGGDNNIVRFSDPTPIVSVLLRSFDKKSPKQSIKTEITKFLDKYIGDPRFESEKWINMDKEKSIFLKWKIGETLKDFFELLSYTAKQAFDADRMWSYRKEFIETYWKAGYIKDAWIVLGKKAYKNRLKFLNKDFQSYGKILKGVNHIHSVLLFQVGDLILSEWNYNGKVRIWNSSKYSPKFYKKEYSREELIKKPKKEFIHSSPNTYCWQKKLSRYIEKYTYISCPEYLQRKIDRFQ